MRRAAAKHGFHGGERWHGKRISAYCDGNDESVEKQREIPSFEKAEIYEGERSIFQKRGERFLRKKERRENRGIKN
jgi:hypothetical protein